MFSKKINNKEFFDWINDKELNNNNNIIKLTIN